MRQFELIFWWEAVVVVVVVAVAVAFVSLLQVDTLSRMMTFIFVNDVVVVVVDRQFCAGHKFGLKKNPIPIFVFM